MGDEIYTNVDGTPYEVDTGVEVSITHVDLETKGHLKVGFADGGAKEMPFGIWKGVVWIKGPHNLIAVRDLKELMRPCKSLLSQRLKEFQAKLVKLDNESQMAWYKMVDIPATEEQRIKECDLLGDILGDINVIIHVNNVFFTDDDEEEHLEWLQKVVEKITEAGLKLNQKNCQLGQYHMDYLGFQVSTDLGLSDSYRKKLEQVAPPTLEIRGYWDYSTEKGNSSCSSFATTRPGNQTGG